jgi:hypothetical protein
VMPFAFVERGVRLLFAAQIAQPQGQNIMGVWVIGSPVDSLSCSFSGPVVLTGVQVGAGQER